MTRSKRIPAMLVAGLLSLGGVGLAMSDADDDDSHEREEHRRPSGGWVRSRPDVAPVTNATYREECGACHMAYQPGLLPAGSWVEIMQPAALGEHYGDDASLSDALGREISTYLTANASDQAHRSRARAFGVRTADTAAGVGRDLPRITASVYFRREHDEIPARMVTDNPEVGSFSQCDSCHLGADRGVYNEHQVRIPGFGAWED